MTSRRAAMLTGVAAAGALLTGCGTDGDKPPTASKTPDAGRSSSSAPSSGAPVRAVPGLGELEKKFDGQLGVYALDTGSGAAVGHRSRERFLMCSTHKLLSTAAVLHRSQRHPALLDRVIRYKKSDILDYAPVTSKHVGEGMTVRALCRAAMEISDNTAANLLTELVGGPRAVTRYIRTLGDPLTRLDRTEPGVNSASGKLDTTTPMWMAADLRALALDQALNKARRSQLADWLKGNTTGDDSIRAGLPKGWAIGDKTGSGANGEVNDVAVAWPPGRKPLVITVFTRPTDPKNDTGYRTVARAAEIARKALAES